MVLDIFGVFVVIVDAVTVESESRVAKELDCGWEDVNCYICLSPRYSRSKGKKN
jgi:hypothetical protein